MRMHSHENEDFKETLRHINEEKNLTRFLRDTIKKSFYADKQDVLNSITRHLDRRGAILTREINESNENGDALVVLALRNRYPLRVIKALIQAGADLNAPLQHGRFGHDRTYAIHLAIGDHEKLKLLIESGARVDTINQEGFTPLEVALTNASPDFPYTPDNDPVSILLDFEIAQSDLNALLWKAHISEHVDALLTRGADIKSVDDEQRTLLHFNNLSPDMVGKIVERGVDPSSRDIQGNTPLHIQNNPVAISFLVKSGADVNSYNEHSQTPLHMATHTAAIEALLENGANPSVGEKDEIINSINYRRNKERIFDPLPGSLIKRLKADPLSVKRRKTIEKIIDKGNNNALREILSNGTDIKDFGAGAPFLHAAIHASKFNPDVFDTLIEYGADINQPCIGAHGGSLLHVLADMSDPLVPELIQRLAGKLDASQEDRLHRTPLGVAASCRASKKDASGIDYRISNCQALAKLGATPNEMDIKLARNIGLKAILRKSLKPHSSHSGNQLNFSKNLKNMSNKSV